MLFVCLTVTLAVGPANQTTEKILEELSRKDYEDLMAVLKPEMEKAKKLVSGKQLLAVCSSCQPPSLTNHLLDREENAPIRPRRQCLFSDT
jgi:hypothetical protein